MVDPLRRFASVVWAALDGAGRSLRANWGMGLLSLILAFALWLVVTESQNPSRVGIFPLPVAVEPANLPSGLAVIGRIEPVRVRISAPEEIWDQLSTSDFRVLADLSNAAEGERMASVRVQVVGGRDVRIESVIPDRVLVRMGPWVSRSVPVLVNLISSPALGYEVGTPFTNPQQVTVSGAAELVNQVEAAVVDVNVFGITAKVRRSLKLAARDSRGLVVEGVTLEPDTAQVEVGVDRKVFTSSYPVVPSLKGDPAPGYNITSIRIEPSTVTLLGPQGTLEPISALTTADIDISGARANVIQRVALLVPPEAKVIGREIVVVQVSIEAGVGEAIFGVAPQWRGLHASLMVQSAVALVEVKLAGPLPLLKSLSPEQVAVTADLSGLVRGVHRLEPQVQVPQGLTVIAVLPRFINVELVPTT